MARKKKAKADVGLPDVLVLTRDELLRLKLAETEIRASESAKKLALLERAQLLAKIDPSGQLAGLEQALSGAVSSGSKAMSAYSQVASEIETRLGIKLADFSFDDETGTLFEHRRA